MGQFKQAEKFLDFIKNNQDLPIKQKISILDYCADELFLRDENLLYLECKLVLKELREQQKTL